MAFDLIKWNRQVYTATTEMVDQQVQLFNANSNGALILAPSNANMGDFALEASFKLISGLVLINHEITGKEKRDNLGCRGIYF